MPSILDELFPENSLDTLNYESFSIPKVNIRENFSTFVVDLAVPGLKKENISIEIEENVLTVSSELPQEQKTTGTESNTQFTKKEFDFHNFKRAFNLPEDVNLDKIKADYQDGILSISVPKAEVKEDIKRMVEIS